MLRIVILMHTDLELFTFHVSHYSTEQQGAVIHQDMLQCTSKGREEEEDCKLVKVRKLLNLKYSKWSSYRYNTNCHTVIAYMKRYIVTF